MDIVDPFKTPAAASKGIVDPFKAGAAEAKPEEGGILSDYGKATAEAFMSGAHSLSPKPAAPERGDSFMSGFFTGPFERGVSGISRATAPLEMALSPVTGAIHSFGGRGLAAAEDYLGKASLSALQKLGLATDTPTLPDKQKVYEQAQADIDKAMLAANPSRTASVAFRTPLGKIGQAVEGDIAATRQAEEVKRAAEAAAKAVKEAAKAPVPSNVQQAQTELADAGTPVELPRALTSTSPVVQSGSVALAKAPVIGTPLNEAIRAVPKQIGAGVESVAGRFSPEMPPNIVGGGVAQSLGEAAAGETAAARTASDIEHAANVQRWEAENLAREQAITSRQAQATNAANRAFGDVAPMEMAQDTANDVQGAHRQALANQNQRYAEVNALDARVDTDAFHGLRDRVEQALSEAGHTIDDPGTNAARMLHEMDRLSGRPGELPANVPPRLMEALQREYGGNVPADVLEQMGFPGAVAPVPPDFRLTGRHAPAPGANAIPVQGLEKLSTRIGRMVGDAETPSDRAASITIKRAFEDWRNDALGSHLTPDSEAGARPAIDAARAAYSDRMNRFGHNYRQLPEGEPRNAAKLLNQIVTGGLGPEGLRDNLIGAKPGNRRVSAPLFEAISQAVPNAGEFRNRLRGAYWNSVSEGGPAALGRNVEGLTPTRMGAHLFDPHEHDLMRGYANLSQQTPEHLREAARIAKANAPQQAAIEPGRSAQTAKELLGRNRSDEQVLGVFDAALREGGNIKLAARAWGRMSEANRNEVRGSWLRGLGGGGEDFSVAKFVKNWDSYSDQAKAIMLDREHRRTIDNFHTIAKQYAESLARYGNPSGTAQVSAWHKLMVGTAKTALAVGTGAASVFHPLGMATAALGGRGIASLLARPAGTRQLTRWTRMSQAYNSAPSTTKLVALQNATRTLASEARK